MPAGFLGLPVIGFNVLTAVERRVWQNALFAQRQRQSTMLESVGQAVGRLHGSGAAPPAHQPLRRAEAHLGRERVDGEIYIFSNDMKTLIRTLGEKNVQHDRKRCGKPQDVAFLPDGRILIADGLDNHRVMIMDKDLNFLGEVGGKGNGPGQFNGVHAIAVGPEGRRVRARPLGQPHRRLQGV